MNICFACLEKGWTTFLHFLCGVIKNLRPMNWPNTFVLELNPIHSPLQVQVIANQLPILVERSRRAGPSINSFLVGWRAIFIPSNACILRKVQEQHVFFCLSAVALFQLWQSWTRASRHFTFKFNKNFSRNEKQSKMYRF